MVDEGGVGAMGSGGVRVVMVLDFVCFLSTVGSMDVAFAFGSTGLMMMMTTMISCTPLALGLRSGGDVFSILLLPFRFCLGFFGTMLEL